MKTYLTVAVTIIVALLGGIVVAQRLLTPDVSTSTVIAPFPSVSTSTRPLPTTSISTSTPGQTPIALGAINDTAIRTTFEHTGSAGSYTFTQPQYIMGYYVPDNSITITLEQPPYGLARKAAEHKLLTLTGQTEEELCAATIDVKYPIDQPPFWVSVGLSFCNDSLPL